MDDDLQSFYGFTRFPFEPITETAQIFRAGSHSSLIDSIVAEVLAGGSVLTVRGERGVGKTILLRNIASRLEAHRLCILQSVGGSQSPLKIQRRIAEAGGYPAAGSLNPEHLLRVLRSEQSADRLVLLFDDADALSTTMFRYLWLLTELSRFGSAKIQLVLVGRTGPWAGLEHPDLERLRQAALSRFFMLSLRDDEATAYLDHKLTYAGQSLRRVMTKAAVAELLQRAEKTPAELDALTERALVQGYLKRQRRVTRTRLRRALPSAPGATPLIVQIAKPSRTKIAAMMSVAVLAGATAVFVSRQIPMAGADRSLAAANLPPAVPPPGVDRPENERLRPEARRQVQPAMVPQTGADGSPMAAASSSATPDATPAVPPPDADQPENETLRPESLPPVPPPPPPAMVAQTGANGSPMASTASSSATPDVAPAVPPPGADRLENETLRPEPTPPIPPPVPPTTVAQTGSDGSPMASAASSAMTPDATPAVPPLGQTAAPPEISSAAPPVNATTSLRRGGGPGLVLVAGTGDDLATLYAKVYRGVKPPPYPAVIAANRMPIRPGALVIFPAPPEGWSTR